MNEARFLFFFLYLLDLHNIKIEGNVKTVANPKYTERATVVADIKKVCFYFDIPIIT